MVEKGDFFFIILNYVYHQNVLLSFCTCATDGHLCCVLEVPSTSCYFIYFFKMVCLVKNTSVVVMQHMNIIIFFEMHQSEAAVHQTGIPSVFTVGSTAFVCNNGSVSGLLYETGKKPGC